MLKLAHRGHHALLPENTLDAFASAMALGFNGIETDVRSSADGVAVLIHDRIAPNGQAVASLTLAQLEQAFGHPIADLQSALDAFPHTFWNIEIKTEAAASLALPILQQYQKRSTILLSSFRHELVLALCQQLTCECALLNAHRPAALASLLHAALPHTHLRTLVWDCEIVDARILEQANALGFRNWVYGCKTRYEHELMANFGVHALISDFPQYLDLA